MVPGDDEARFEDQLGRRPARLEGRLLEEEVPQRADLNAMLHDAEANHLEVNFLPNLLFLKNVPTSTSFCLFSLFQKKVSKKCKMFTGIQTRIVR